MLPNTKFILCELVEGTRKNVQKQSVPHFYIKFTFHNYPSPIPPVKKTYSLNKINPITKRRKQAKKMVRDICVKLDTGWSPLSNEDAVLGNTNIIAAFDFVMKLKLEILKKRKTRRPTEQLRVVNKGGKNRKSYQPQLNIFKAFLVKKKMDKWAISDLNSSIIQMYLDDLFLNKNLRGRTINNHRAALHNLCEMLYKRNYLSANPVKRVDKFFEEDKLRESIEDDEAHEILEYFKKTDSDLYFAVSCIYYLLIRIEELLTIRVQDIDIQNKHIKVIVFKKHEFDYRTIPAPFIEQLQKRIIGEKVQPDWFIVGKNLKIGRHSSTPRRLQERHQQRLVEIDRYTVWKGPYTWKYYAMGKLYKTGLKETFIKDHASHEDERTTRIYRQTKPKFIKDIHENYPSL